MHLLENFALLAADAHAHAASELRELRAELVEGLLVFRRVDDLMLKKPPVTVWLMSRMLMLFLARYVQVFARMPTASLPTTVMIIFFIRWYYIKNGPSSTAPRCRAGRIGSRSLRRGQARRNSGTTSPRALRTSRNTSHRRDQPPRGREGKAESPRQNTPCSSGSVDSGKSRGEEVEGLRD